MIFPEPEKRVGDQKALYLAPTKIKIARSPAVRLAPPLGLVLIKRCAVKFIEPPLVLGKMRGHPIKDHADTARVQPVHKGTKLLGSAEA